MNRTAIYKTIYLGIVLFGTVAVSWVIIHFQLRFQSVAVLLIAGLIPGKILGYFWRNLLRGLRLLREKDYAASKMHSELFLEELDRKPWLKHFIWLGTSTYSRNPRSLALNNLGAAELSLGEDTPARLHFEESIKADSLNPLPYFNLGVLAQSEDRLIEAEGWFKAAIARGYSKSIVDRIVTASQHRFASSNGRGASADRPA